MGCSGREGGKQKELKVWGIEKDQRIQGSLTRPERKRWQCEGMQQKMGHRKRKRDRVERRKERTREGERGRGH